jgi:peptide/nickel transport system substrate-binding protein
MRWPLLIVLATACPAKKSADPDAGALSPPAAPSADWLAGRLPREALEGEPRRGGTLTLRVHIEPAGLNRLHDQMAEGTMARYTFGTVYESLAELDRDTHPRYDLKPLLATSWDESEDHLALTVRLRQGVRFHDGSSFTSADVKAVVEAVRDPKHATRSIGTYFEDLASLDTPDPHTVVVRWKRPYFLANRNFLTALPMMPARALEGDFDTLAINRAPVGTGPWRFVAWETGRAITFTRFEGYWGQSAWLDNIVVRFVKDDTVAVQLWEHGELDLMTRIPPTVWRSIEAPTPANAWAVRGYHRASSVENNYSWVGWNEQRPFFADRRVRAALAHLYPADEVAKNVDLGLETPTTCPYFDEGPSCDPAVKPLAFDPARAARLLDEAGWRDTDGDGVRERDGRRFAFVFLATPAVRLGKILPLYQERLRRAGIEMAIEKIDAAAYLKRLRENDFDACALTWSSPDPVQDNYQVFHSSQTGKNGSNFVSYQNPEVDRLLEQIRSELDPVRRAALERQVHRALYDDQVYLFLTRRLALDAIKVGVKGLKPSMAWYDLRRAYRARP